jgi:hypothetical protein
VFVQAALIAAQMWLGEITRPRPKKVTFAEFLANNKPSEVRPVAYGAGTFEITPPRIWYGDFKQRAVERDSHWTDYLWAGLSAGLLDFITVAYRYYIGEAFQLCWGPDTHVERVTINDRLMYQATIGFDNAGSGFLIDDPQAWGGDQPPGEGGEYAWIDITRGNYTDAANAYVESLLSTPPNKTQSLRGISCIFKRGPTGFRESGYFAAGGVGASPRLKEWKVVCRRQPDNLATGFNKVGRHANPMEVIYEWATSLEYGARLPTSEINLASWQSVAEDLYNEGSGWSGRIEGQTQPIEVVRNVLAQIDGVLDPSPSLGLTMRLIRRDYSFANLRTLDRNTVVSITRFSPGTYDDTVNKIIVPFEDQNNNFEPRPGIYIDVANQTIQDGRIVPQTQDYKGVGDYDTANALATRDGRALSVPRAPLECTVRPSFGRLTYRGEVLKFNWSTPTFTKLMRVLSVTPGNNEDPDYALECIEDQFASGFRVSGEPQTGFDDPAEGLNTAPPSVTWNTTDFPQDGLTFALLLDNTNQFNATITGGIVFATYAPGGQYARVYVTEPGGVQTLSPMILSPDADDKAMFQWPAVAAGTYRFCVQTFSLRGATNGVKVCADIVVANIGSPSASPSASVSPSHSVSPSVSPSPSISQSPSISPSHSSSASPSSSASVSPSISPSSSQSPSSSTSASTSASVSPSSSASASVSPSPSTSPSSSTSPSISPSASTSPSSSASPSASAAVVGQALTYTGNGSSQSVGGADFSPDLVIIRRRSGSSGSTWRWMDDVRGGTKSIASDTTQVEATSAQLITSFDANGFSVGNNADINSNTVGYVAFLLQLVASAFDIVLYNGTGVAHTVSHGLGVTPELIIVRARTTSGPSWRIYPGPLSSPGTKGLAFDNTAVSSSSTYWNNTAATSTDFTVGTNTSVNANGGTYVAFLFASVNPGVKVGSYTGDGNTNGPVVTTGFRPRFVLIKRTDASGDWVWFDDQRDASSPHSIYGNPNIGGVTGENTCTNSAGGLDFQATGFQSIDSDGTNCAINVNGATYIYLAVA